jgi:hypothetical protein
MCDSDSHRHGYSLTLLLSRVGEYLPKAPAQTLGMFSYIGLYILPCRAVSTLIAILIAWWAFKFCITFYRFCD